MTGQRETDAHLGCAGHDSGPAQVDQSIDSHRRDDAHSPAADALVLIAADVLDDLERVRIATENRLRSLTHAPVEGERGGWFGKGLSPDMPEVGRVRAIFDGLADLEHQATLNLQRAVRKHPLGGWVRRTIGVGEKQAGRLLAAIGNPADRATVSQLWAYCGYHVINPTGHAYSDTQMRTAGGEALGDHPGHRSSDAQMGDAGVAPKRRRGQKANWSTTAKTRAYLVAESCIKQRSSPYRAVYDTGREKYAEAVHAHPCERCGPSGKPAQPGSPLSDGHKHARAMRLVAKAILRDLWIEARRTDRPSTPSRAPSGGLSSAPTDQPARDAHHPPVGGGTSTSNGQSDRDAQRPTAVAGNPRDTDHIASTAHSVVVGVSSSGGEAA